MAKGDIITEVFEYVRNNRGKLVTLDDVRRGTGHTAERAQYGMRQIKNRGLWPVTTYISGRAWRLGVSEDHPFPVTYNNDQPQVDPDPIDPIPEPDPEPEPVAEPDPEPGNFGPWPDATDDASQSGRLFECLGDRPGGKVVLRRDDGLLYTATLEPL